MEVPTIYFWPIFEAYVRKYPHKILPYMVQYLHFRILKLPLNKPGVLLRRARLETVTCEVCSAESRWSLKHLPRFLPPLNLCWKSEKSVLRSHLESCRRHVVVAVPTLEEEDLYSKVRRPQTPIHGHYCRGKSPGIVPYGSKHLLRRSLTPKVIPQSYFLRRYLDILDP